MPAASDSERASLRAFFADLTRRRSLPGDPDGREAGVGAQMSDRLHANLVPLRSHSLGREERLALRAACDVDDPCAWTAPAMSSISAVGGSPHSCGGHGAAVKV
jgi:hypothetical protein